MKKITKKHKKEKIKVAIEAIIEMAKVKVAPSPIHGVGVFALRDIKKGERLDVDAVPHVFDVPYSDFKKLPKEIAELILGQYPLIVNGSHFLYPTTRFLTYMNHSDDANYDAKDNVVLKDIKAGEEVVEDYRKIEGYEKVFTWLK